MLSRVMAVLLGILAASSFAELTMALMKNGRPFGSFDLLAGAAELTLSLACLWMLIALDRQRSGDSSCKVQASMLLRRFTWVLLALGAFSLVGQSFGMISLAFVYHNLESHRSIFEKSPYSTGDLLVMMMFPFQRLLTTACVFTPAYVVWRGWLRQAGSKVPFGHGLPVGADEEAA
jgi:hypothetical protein